MKTRMQPIRHAWSKLPRMVRDLSAELGKRIDLVMLGEGTELDRQVLELIRDPLTHMVRNSADHGLESQAVRLAAGKPATGTITLNSFHEGGHIVIEVARRRRRAADRAHPGARAGAGAGHGGGAGRHVGAAGPPLHLPCGPLDRAGRHRRVRPRRRHGRGEDQHRAARRHGGPAQRGRPGNRVHRQDPAHPRHHLGPDRRGWRAAPRPAADLRGRAGARGAGRQARRWRPGGGTAGRRRPCCGCASQPAAAGDAAGPAGPAAGRGRRPAP